MSRLQTIHKQQNHAVETILYEDRLCYLQLTL